MVAPLCSRCGYPLSSLSIEYRETECEGRCTNSRFEFEVSMTIHEWINTVMHQTNNSDRVRVTEVYMRHYDISRDHRDAMIESILELTP